MTDLIEVADPITLRFTIEFTSEWHVGSGRGRPGDVDRLVKRRRRSRLPYVPAKSLTGVWRWSAEQIAASQPHLADGELLRAVFGDTPAEDAVATNSGKRGRSRPRVQRPAPAAAAIRGADLSPDVAEALGYDAAFATMTVQQTAITPEGVAKAMTLRRIEVTRRGSVLHGSVAVDPARLPSLEHGLALLVLSGLRLRRLGGKRNRGFGELRLRFDAHPAIAGGAPDPGAQLVWAVRVLATATATATAAAGARGAARAPSGAGPGVSEGEPVELGLRIEALDRLVIEDRVVGNVTRTTGHLPGTRLLAVVASLLRRAGIDPTPLIEADRLQVRNAYPDVDGTRGLPVPLSFSEPARPFREGGHERAGLGSRGRGVVNAAASERPAGAHLYRQCRSGWLSETAVGTALRYRAPLATEIETMNIIDDRTGRTSSDVGGLYSYETLHDGEVFHSVVSAPPDVVAALVAAIGGGVEDAVGTSKKDDFGRIRITPVPAPAQPNTPEMAVAIERFTIWCVSPLIVIDETALPATSMEGVCAELSRRLETSVTVEEHDGEPLAWSRPWRSESFKAKWGLPNPSLTGIAAGSVVVLRAANPVPAQALRRLERDGLGSRRAAGFGEIRVASPIAEGPRYGHDVYRFEPDEPQTGSGATAVPVSAFVEAARLAAWRSAVLRSAGTITLDDLIGPHERTIQRSQLGAYQAVVASLTAPDETVWLPKTLDTDELRGPLGELPSAVLGRLGLEPPVPDGEHVHWREAVQIVLAGAVRNTLRGSAEEERP